MNTSYLPVGESVTKFELWNDGDSENIFNVNIQDELGWMQYNNTISLDSGNSYSIHIPTDVYDTLSDNLITIEVCPLTSTSSECIYTMLNSKSCSTNPNYNFSDSSECPELLIGDINFDNEINILDVVNLVSIIINSIELTEEQSIVGDLNYDSSINVLDIILLVDAILS